MVSRRTMLALGAGVAGASMAATTTPAVASTVVHQPSKPAPRTLSASRMVRNGRLSVRRTTFPVTHLGVTWRGPSAHVRVRTATGWSRWRTLDDCGAGPDGRSRPDHGVVLVVPGTVAYDVAVAGGGRAQVIELNTVDGPAIPRAATLTVPPPPPPAGTLASYGVPYLSRAAWGADESLRFRNGVEVWPPEYYPVQALTVHHTAGANGDPDPAATVRAIYHYQAVVVDGTGWGDLGYHLLIDEAGRVYEGRWSGTDGVSVFGANTPPLMSVGAHVGGYNTGNIGVCLLGHFNGQLPTTAARESLVRVLAWLAHTCWLDPLGMTHYVNPVNGNTRDVDTISGHRNWAATACPGDMFYPQLAAVRSSVAQVPRRKAGGWRPPIPRPGA